MDLPNKGWSLWDQVHSLQPDGTAAGVLLLMDGDAAAAEAEVVRHQMMLLITQLPSFLHPLMLLHLKR